MKFLKEYVIIIVILVIVFLIEYVTSKQLGEATAWMRDGITSIENKMNENNESEAEKEFYELEEKWRSECEKLSLFVEHNELEKVSKEVALINSNFKTNKKSETLEKISELKFMLEHIEEKNQLKLKNVF